MPFERLEKGKMAAAIAVTPNTEKISSAVTDNPCIGLLVQKTYTAISASAMPKPRM